MDVYYSGPGKWSHIVNLGTVDNLLTNKDQNNEMDVLNKANCQHVMSKSSTCVRGEGRKENFAAACIKQDGGATVW